MIWAHIKVANSPGSKVEAAMESKVEEAEVETNTLVTFLTSTIKTVVLEEEEEAGVEGAAVATIFKEEGASTKEETKAVTTITPKTTPQITTYPTSPTNPKTSPRISANSIIPVSATKAPNARECTDSSKMTQSSDP